MEKLFRTVVGVACFMALMGGGVATASVITWFGPTNASNGSSTISAGTAYTSNLGVAFKTGAASGGYSMDWVTLGLSTGIANASGTFKLSLHDTTDDIAYSAVAGTTEYAVDMVSYTAPTGDPFVLNLTATDIPNITAYTMAANTAYSLLLYNASGSVALRRTQNLANGTTNDNYTVSDGFVALDTFRNNTPNYANNVGTGSYVTFDTSFGATTAVPEPSTYALLCISLGVVGYARRRMVRKL